MMEMELLYRKAIVDTLGLKGSYNFVIKKNEKNENLSSTVDSTTKNNGNR